MRRLVLALLLSSAALAARAGTPGNDLDQLTPGQADVARRMLVFMGATEQDFWRQVDEVNGRDAPVEFLELDIPGNGLYEVRVKRGTVAEKAGSMWVNTSVEKPPFVIGGRWNRFIELAVHPRNPLVGMLHATFSVQVSSKGVGNIGATMDMMKVNQPPEDLALMDERVTAVFRKYGMDREKWRSKGCNKPNDGPWKWHRDGTCTGVSMYGPDLVADDRTFSLVSELYATVVNTYFEILRRRADQAFTPADQAAQDFSRRRWLEDQLFWDAVAKNFVPYAAWSAVNAPPLVRY